MVEYILGHMRQGVTLESMYHLSFPCGVQISSFFGRIIILVGATAALLELDIKNDVKMSECVECILFWYSNGDKLPYMGKGKVGW